jgi:hypothetical protein
MYLYWYETIMQKIKRVLQKKVNKTWNGKYDGLCKNSVPNYLFSLIPLPYLKLKIL